MRFFFLAIILILTVPAVAGAPLDDAKRLYNEGLYENALESLQTLRAKSPRDGNVNYWLGLTLSALGRNVEAEKYLTVAEGRNVADAALALAHIAKNDYRPEDAAEHLDTYEQLLRKAKKDVPESVDRERSQLVAMENMLSRVERITVIDSLVVDATGFFKHYRLAPEAGRIVNGAMLRMPDVEMVFMPQDNTQIIYSEPDDSTGVFVLKGADILDDGTIERAEPLPGEDLSGGGNAEYPFLMSDGMTLYFANDGEGSLGGYDIFLTRRNDDGFLQPQNVGMPYNSPDDDYLLAIDEVTGAGWWATDRNHIPGKVTIYIFEPSATRVNVDPDDENLTSLARLDNIRLTQTNGVNQDVVNRLEALKNGLSETTKTDAGAVFDLPVGSTEIIYHNLSDFKSAEGKKSMTKALDAKLQIERISRQLTELRDKYRNGDRSCGGQILNLESELDEARTMLKTFTNKAIESEQKALKR